MAFRNGLIPGMFTKLLYRMAEPYADIYEACLTSYPSDWRMDYMARYDPICRLILIIGTILQQQIRGFNQDYFDSLCKQPSSR